MCYSERTNSVRIVLNALVLLAGNVGIAQGQCRPNELTKLPAREPRPPTCSAAPWPSPGRSSSAGPAAITDVNGFAACLGTDQPARTTRKD